MSGTAVIYLARGEGAGASAAKRFLASYLQREAGEPYQFHALFKGWEGVAGKLETEQSFQAAGATIHQLPDDGFDWGAYFRAASLIGAEKLLFLNSHSELLADGWLSSLSRGLGETRCGMAGATGSWGSATPPLPILWKMLGEREPPLSLPGKLVRYVHAGLLGRLSGWSHGGPRLAGFPNPHLRSNAFIIRRSDFMAFAAARPMPQSKRDAWGLESGPESLTQFLAQRGLETRVVDHRGASFPSGAWIEAGTFRTPALRNLLIADNQTRTYEGASNRQRRLLELSAWGQTLTDVLPITRSGGR